MADEHRGEVKRQETHPAGPAKGEEFVPFEATASLVVMHTGKQLDNLEAEAVIEAVLDDQHFSRCLLVSNSMNCTTTVTKQSREFPPVIARILEELGRSILPESQPQVADNAPGKVGPDKRQGKNGGGHDQRLCPAQFADIAAV